MTRERISAVAIGLVLLTACGGGGSSGGAAPSAGASPCTSGTGATFTLVSPTPGSTTSTSTDTTFQMQATVPITASAEFELVDKNGAVTLGGQIIQTSSSPIVYSSTTPNPLTAGDSFTVYLLNTGQSGCTPVAIAGATFNT